MNHDKLLQENKLAVDKNLIKDNSLIGTRTNAFDVTDFDTNFGDIPFYKIRPVGIDMTLLRDVGIFDFGDTSTNKPTILN